MTITASNHCAKQFSHSAPGLISGHTFGPPPTFGAWHRKENVFYIDASVIVLPDTRIASGEDIVIAEFEDHRGGLVDPQDGTSKRVLHVVVIPESLAPGDYVHLSIGGEKLGVDVPATLMQNVVIPGVGIKQTPVQIVQAKAPPAPAPVVITPTKPITGRTNGNGKSPATIPASIITPSTPRQIVVPLDPSDRQLVVYESNTANSDYGRMFGIPPGDARGIGLPAYKIVTSLPALGGVAGEAVFDSSTKAAYVWDGNVWQNMPPKAEVKPWDPALPYNQNTIVEAFDKLWLSTGAVPVNSAPSSSNANWKALTGLMHTFEIWDAAKQYFANDLVLSGHALWKAKVDSLNVNPPDWTVNTTSPEWDYQGLIPFEIGTPEEGGVLTWTGNGAMKGGVFQIMAPKAALKNWTGTEVYLPGQLVVYKHGIYNAILASPQVSAISNPDLTPTLHQNNSHWEFWGSLPNALGEPQDGDSFVWDDVNKDWIYGAPGGEVMRRTSGASTGADFQAIAALATTPKKYFKFDCRCIINGSVGQYWIPSIIVEDTAGWVDFGSQVIASVFWGGANHGRSIDYALTQPGVPAFSTWGHSGDGLRTVPPTYIHLMPDGAGSGGRIIVEAHKNIADNKWDVAYKYVGEEWGNGLGEVDLACTFDAVLFDTVKSFGIKFLKQNTANANANHNFRYHAEWI